MRLLLDTQVALWWLTANPRLSKLSRELMDNSQCYVSVASVWEVELKHRLGKLPVGPTQFRNEVRAAGVTILSITDEHVLTTVQAAQSHRDPFDRLLLSVAEAESLSFLTADSALMALGYQGTNLSIRQA